MGGFNSIELEDKLKESLSDDQVELFEEIFEQN